MLHVDSDPVQDLTQLSQLLPVRQALVTQYGLGATSSENSPKMGLNIARLRRIKLRKFAQNGFKILLDSERNKLSKFAQNGFKILLDSERNKLRMFAQTGFKILPDSECKKLRKFAQNGYKILPDSERS